MMRTTICIAAAVASLADAAATPATPPSFPIYYAYGGYPRVMANISYGTPKQAPIPTVIDLGSANYWVYGNHANVTYGSPYLGVQGPCSLIAQPHYNDTASSTATREVLDSVGYAYGGNGKLVGGYFTVNDTLSFPASIASSLQQSTTPTIANRRVALANNTLIKGLMDCTADLEYDHSILGLSAFANPTVATTGPSFRQDLLDDGLIQTSAFSMWFDKGPSSFNGTYYGTALFGAVPSSKYTGPLVFVKPNPPKDSTYVGYYVSTPTAFSTGVQKTAKTSNLTMIGDSCLLDSGTGIDSLPINYDDFMNVSDPYPCNASCASCFPGVHAC